MHIKCQGFIIEHHDVQLHYKLSELPDFKFVLILNPVHRGQYTVFEN